MLLGPAALILAHNFVHVLNMYCATPALASVMRVCRCGDPYRSIGQMLTIRCDIMKPGLGLTTAGLNWMNKRRLTEIHI